MARTPYAGSQGTPHATLQPVSPQGPVPTPPVGALLREWRQRRRLSQLDLALDTDVSARHLSFLETGRASPSRQMLMRLAERLAVPLRERNALLLAAGYAPLYRERPLADPQLQAGRRAVELILRGHAPYPALAVNSHWELLQANDAALRLMAGVAPELLRPPVNVLRVSLHPQGLAPHIVNLPHWRAHVLTRLRQQMEASGQRFLEPLLAELQALPAPAVAHEHEDGGEPGDDLGGVAVPLRLRTPLGVLSFISTTTVFGTPLDVTLSEMALETFFPADEATAQALHALAKAG